MRQMETVKGLERKPCEEQVRSLGVSSLEKRLSTDLMAVTAGS